MKSIWFVPLALAATACSKPAETGSATSASEAEQASAPSTAATRDQPPGIDPSVAPGVAFDFRYAFSLPETQIAATQEAHATLCGRLGVTHCRVTGLNFDKSRDGSIDASTTFMLDPALALGFARDATALVEKAEGKLETSSVKGENAGKAIVEGDKSADGIKAELARIDAQLRIPNLSKSARGELATRAADLRSQLTELARTRDADVESLATTPVAFDYEVGGASSFTAPLRQGLSASSTSFAALLSFLALTIGMFGPWLIVGGAIVWFALRLRRRRPVVSE